MSTTTTGVGTPPRCRSRTPETSAAYEWRYLIVAIKTIGIRRCEHCGQQFIASQRGAVVQRFCHATCARRARMSGECSNGHPFDEENTFTDGNGFRRCKACRIERNRRWRSKPRNRELVNNSNAASRRRHPEEASARNEVRKAIRSGALTRPDTCQRCGQASEWPIEASHDDYSRPLDIEWLCKRCHAQKDWAAARIRQDMAS